ncbi:hypothetical protein GC167_05995 [bacterium]|nr:hypothetical protein [bacterium]
MWICIDAESETHASEVSGVGVIVTAPGYGMCFVPGARLVKGRLQREDRTTPPLHSSGLTAAEIRAKQPLIPDEGALSYLVLDEDTPEY